MNKTNLLTQDDLLKKTRTLTYPLDIFLPDGSLLQLQESLRVIPNKRLTARGEWQNNPVIAKIFFKPRKAAYYAERDRAGVNALVQAGIPTPTLYYAGQTQLKNVYVLIFEFIEDAIPLSQLWEEALEPKAQLRVLIKTIHTIAKQHDAGLLQKDMHTNNFLIKKSRFYSLDGDGVKQITRRKAGLRARKGLRNLAALAAKMSFVHEINWHQVFLVYCNFRHIRPSKWLFSRFHRYIVKQIKESREEVLKKTLRECSRFVKKTSLTLRAIWAREEKKVDLSQLLPVLEQRVKERPPAEEITLTKRFSCIKLPAETQPLMVKHYIPRHFFEGFWTIFGISKAKKAWVNSHHLDLLRVPGVGSLALCEKGFFPWYGKTFLISKFVEGTPLDQFVSMNEKNHEKIADIFNAIAGITDRLARSQMTYGSMSASNFLVTEKGILLTNFDQVKQHYFERSFKRQSSQDVQCFFANWHDKPDIVKLAESAFKKGEKNT
ncbi:MAG: hypothetical protein HKM04_05705 [Legionellales bacterium]|nr:hypothetical protein [Legionellales bacterium]